MARGAQIRRHSSLSPHGSQKFGLCEGSAIPQLLHCAAGLVSSPRFLPCTSLPSLTDGIAALPSLGNPSPQLEPANERMEPCVGVQRKTLQEWSLDFLQP